MSDWKKTACAFIDEHREILLTASREIYNNPELKFEETRATALLAEELRRAGFSVETGVADLPTAIRAAHPESAPGPTVAILGEYDALPLIGHACGHNLIAAAGLGAALAVGSIKADLPGTLLFFGSPGEEGGGGKVLMVEAGLFDGVDAAMMFHPASGSPEKGVNALDAVIQTFNGLNALRQHIKDGARIHGIITDGGAKPNIVPEHAAACFYVRAAQNAYRDELLEKLRHCAEGAALATGATLTFRTVGHAYQAMKPNHALGAAFVENLEALGEPLNPPPADEGMGSTDMGDVSQVVPAIHAYIQICGDEVAGHSREFAAASISERGQAVMLTAAKALAMTAIDVLTNPELVGAAKSEFEAAHP